MTTAAKLSTRDRLLVAADVLDLDGLGDGTYVTVYTSGVLLQRSDDTTTWLGKLAAAVDAELVVSPVKSRPDGFYQSLDVHFTFRGVGFHAFEHRTLPADEITLVEIADADQFGREVAAARNVNHPDTRPEHVGQNAYEQALHSDMPQLWAEVARASAKAAFARLTRWSA
jgi:hypothetical protein